MEKPEHYKSRTINDLDVIDIVKLLDLNFNEGNILKYLFRTKGERKADLLKIIDYAQRELNYISYQPKGLTAKEIEEMVLTFNRK